MKKHLGCSATTKLASLATPFSKTNTLNMISPNLMDVHLKMILCL